MVSTFWASVGAILAILIGFIYTSAPWWWYTLLVIGLAVSFAFIALRGYNKIKPAPVVGIPCPPLTHPVLGHPDLMVK